MDRVLQISLLFHSPLWRLQRGRNEYQGFQKALTLLFPRVTAPNDGDVSTALQRFKQAGPLNCEDFVAMYLEAHKGGMKFQAGEKSQLKDH